MSSVRRNFWSNKPSTLDTDFGIPTDVTFIINGENSSEDQGEVKAHKMFLSMASPVFRKQFYGSLADKKEMINVRGTTKKAFEGLIEFIYEVDISWETQTVVELFQLVNLAHKYLIPEMEEYVRNILENTDLTMETVVEVAATAEEFAQFEETSSCLFMHCTNYLQNHLTTSKSCLEFAGNHAGTQYSGTAVRLMAACSGKQTLQHKCSNCAEHPCKDGNSLEAYLSLAGPQVLGLGVTHTRKGIIRRGTVKSCILPDKTVIVELEDPVWGVPCQKDCHLDSLTYRCSPK